MSAKYLLPCACGQRIVIERRQAGQTIPCSCGRSLQAPTLLAMSQLEPAPAESASMASRSTWGLKEGLRLIGVVLVLFAFGFAVWLYTHQPRSRFDAIDPEYIRQTAKNLSPSRTWDVWETMKQGLDRRIDQQYAAAVLQFRAWQILIVAVALVGAGLIVGSMMGARKNRFA